MGGHAKNLIHGFTSWLRARPRLNPHNGQTAVRCGDSPDLKFAPPQTPPPFASKDAKGRQPECIALPANTQHNAGSFGQDVIQRRHAATLMHASRQVFWLPGHPNHRAFPTLWSVAECGFITGYSGGTAPELNGIPY